MTLTEEQSALESGIAHIVFWVAARVAKKYPRYEPGELAYFGWKGLRRAAIEFRPELGFKFSTYAVCVIESEIRSSIRKEVRRDRLVSDDQEWLERAEAASNGDAADAGLDVRWLLQRLDAIDRDTYRRLYVEGANQLDAARALGLSAWSAGSRHDRLIARCRRVLGVDLVGRPRGRMSTKPVVPAKPCVNCGDIWGFTRRGERKPRRQNGLCTSCWCRARRRAKAAKAAESAATRCEFEAAMAAG